MQKKKLTAPMFNLNPMPIGLRAKIAANNNIYKLYIYIQGDLFK